jgi:simple sugar transport system permease protein
VFRSTRWGFEVDMIGGNPRAAEFAGMKVTRRIVVVMLISGAIAGVSGMLHLAGPAQRLNSSISNNYGLSGFIVAALAGASVVGLVAGAVFIAAALHAGITLQSDGLSVFIVAAVYGIVLLGIAVGEVAARFRLVRAGRAEVLGVT